MMSVTLKLCLALAVTGLFGCADGIIPRPAFVREVIAAGFRSADGVQIFRHPDKGTPQWEVVKEGFNRAPHW